MKKYIAFLLAAVIVLLPACAPPGFSSGTTPVDTTVTAAPTTAPTSSAIDLRNYDCGIDNSVFNKDTLAVLTRQAVEILNSGEEFWVANDFYLYYFYVNCPAVISANRTGDKIIVDFPFEGRTDVKMEAVCYLIVLHFIIKEYADYIYARKSDPIYTPDYKKEIMHLSMNYKQAGYDTVKAYLQAQKNGECEVDPNRYYIDLASPRIFQGKTSDNLYILSLNEALQSSVED